MRRWKMDSAIWCTFLWGKITNSYLLGDSENLLRLIFLFILLFLNSTLLMINLDQTVLLFFAVSSLNSIFLNLWQLSKWIVRVHLNMFSFYFQKFPSLFMIFFLDLWGDDNFISDSLFLIFIDIVGHIVKFDENFSLFTCHIWNKYFQDRVKSIF